MTHYFYTFVPSSVRHSRVVGIAQKCASWIFSTLWALVSLIIPSRPYFWCCCVPRPHTALAIAVAYLAAYVALKNKHSLSLELLEDDADTTVPFVRVPLIYEIANVPCYKLPRFDNVRAIGEQTTKDWSFGGRRVSDYVRSMRAHVDTHQLVGLTAYHVGVPLCVLVLRDSGRRVIHTLYNPFVSSALQTCHLTNSSNGAGSGSEQGAIGEDDESIIVEEADIACPSSKTSHRKRNTNVCIHYIDHAGASKQLHFNSTEALVVQNLLDTMLGYSHCNYPLDERELQ